MIAERHPLVEYDQLELGVLFIDYNALQTLYLHYYLNGLTLAYIVGCYHAIYILI